MWKKIPEKEENNLPERMTTLTSFSSLEISELEVKGLILSLLVNRSGTDVNLPGAGAQMKHSCQLLTSVPSLFHPADPQK